MVWYTYCSEDIHLQLPLVQLALRDSCLVIWTLWTFSLPVTPGGYVVPFLDSLGVCNTFSIVACKDPLDVLDWGLMSMLSIIQ